MGHPTVIKGGAAEDVSVSSITKLAKEVGASYFALRHQRCALEDAQKSLEIEKAKRQMHTANSPEPLH